MNKEKPIRDQAERLRKRVERKSEQAVEKKESLPPRSEMHRQKQKKNQSQSKIPCHQVNGSAFHLAAYLFFQHHLLSGWRKDAFEQVAGTCRSGNDQC